MMTPLAVTLGPRRGFGSRRGPVTIHLTNPAATAQVRAAFSERVDDITPDTLDSFLRRTRWGTWHPPYSMSRCCRIYGQISAITVNDCQWPLISAHGRPADAPAGGQ